MGRHLGRSNTRRATIRPVGDDERLDGQERRAKVRPKVIIAAERPWRGSVYETRAGKRREQFDGPEEFLRASTRLTVWQLSDD